ncbi:MAG: hypothetical protein ACYC9Q_14630 [Bacillota bacterium]
MKGFLTIEVTAAHERIPLGSFLKVAGAALQILRDLNVSVAQGAGDKTVKWTISDVSLNSPLRMTLFGSSKDPSIAGEVIGAYVDGFRGIEESAKTPPYFTDSSMQRAREIASVLNDGISKISFISEKTVATPTQRVAANVDSILKVYRDKVTLEGRLEMISIHDGLKFNIYDPTTDRAIPCEFPPEILDVATKEFTNRVSVYGTATYNRAGRPLVLKVESINRLRERSELPQFGETGPIDITGGLDAARYTRALRDE